MQNNNNDRALQLWNGVLAGNTAAFNGLMSDFYAELYKYGYSLSEDAENVKDCIQNVFLTIWKNRTSLKSIDHVKFYLLKSLRREIYRQLQKENQTGNNTVSYLYTTEETEVGTENNIIKKEEGEAMSQRVQDVMLQLPKRQQEVIYLRYYMALKPEEIAEMTGINKQSVYNLLHDALKRFKQKL